MSRGDSHAERSHSLSAVVEQLLPTFVLTSTNADDAFLQSLEDKLATLPLPPAASLASTASTSDYADRDKVRIEYRPARDFYSTAGKYALSRVKITHRPTSFAASDSSEADAERDAAIFDDRETRYRELRLESLLNSLTANPLTVRPVSNASAGETDADLAVIRLARLRGRSSRPPVERSVEGR